MLPSPVLEHAVLTKLKDYQDIELVLLKGHLILEQVLNETITAHGVNSERLVKMNLMFAKTLELAMALNNDAMDKRYLHLREINRIRNKVAHEIFFDDYHDELKNWASNVLGYKPKTINTKRTYRNHVIKAFSALSGFLLGLSTGTSVIKEHAHDALLKTVETE